MKVALASASLIASASAFTPQTTCPRANVALNALSRRDAMINFGATAAAFGVPAIANAAKGESPRFSVFGVFGDGTSYSEGAAYGSDQSKRPYSPYSVYGAVGEDSLYVKNGGKSGGYDNRKKEILAETRKRIENLPAYIEKKKWSEVKTELTRFMYETRGAVRGLSKTREQQEVAASFFDAIERCSLNATLKKQEDCMKGATDALATIEKFCFIDLKATVF